LLDRRANSFTHRDLASIFTNERETLMGDCDQLRKRTPEKAGDGSIAPAAELFACTFFVAWTCEQLALG